MLIHIYSLNQYAIIILFFSGIFITLNHIYYAKFKKYKYADFLGMEDKEFSKYSKYKRISKSTKYLGNFFFACGGVLVFMCPFFGEQDLPAVITGNRQLFILISNVLISFIPIIIGSSITSFLTKHKKNA